MSSERIAGRIGPEILELLDSRKSLFLSSLTPEGETYASYAPFATSEDCIYVLLSEIAVHAVNLQANPKASVLIIEDEDSASELFARLRVTYQIKAELLAYDSEAWHAGRDILSGRHGNRIVQLSQLGDFKLFKLVPQGGRYIKGFGRAFAFEGQTLTGETIAHMKDGHKKRTETEAGAKKQKDETTA